MLNWFVGPVDVPAAAVLIAIAISGAIAFSIFMGVYTSKQETANKFELAKLAQSAETSIKMAALANERDREAAKITANRDIEVRRIDTGMIEGTKVVKGGGDYDAG